MFSKFSPKPQWAIFIAIAGIALVGCGHGLSGKYVSSNGPMDLTLDFQSGDKVMATAMGSTSEGTYKVDGDQVTVYVNGKNMVLTQASDGSLTGGPMGMTFKKE